MKVFGCRPCAGRCGALGGRRTKTSSSNIWAILRACARPTGTPCRSCACSCLKRALRPIVIKNRAPGPPGHATCRSALPRERFSPLAHLRYWRRMMSDRGYKTDIFMRLPDAETHPGGLVAQVTVLFLPPPTPSRPGRLKNSSQRVAAPRHCRRASIAQLAKDRSNASRCSREWIGIEIRRNRGDRKAAVSIQTGIPLGHSHQM